MASIISGGTQAPSRTTVPVDNDTGAEYSSSMTIEELSAPTGAQPRVVTLQGPSLPFMGAEWSGENALDTEWYPGNGDEASQQDMGPREVPSSWKGEWNRTRMGRAPTQATDDTGSPQVLVDPNLLAEMLEDMFRAGQRLRVTWNVTSESQSSRGKKVREGRARKWSFKYTRIQDIEWEVEFEWQSRGQRVQKVADLNQGGLAAASAGLALALSNMASVAAVQPFIAENSSIPNSASVLTLGQLENFASAPTKLVASLARSVEQVETQLTQVAQIATTLSSQPVQVVEAAINVARNSIALLNQTFDQLGRVPVEDQTASSDVRDLLRSYRYFGQTQDAMSQASVAAQQLVAQMQQRAPTPAGAGVLTQQGASSAVQDFVATYVTKDGDTPQRISQRFYGNPDHAVDILQANHLPWGQPTFPTRTILFIPALRKQQQLV